MLPTNPVAWWLLTLKRTRPLSYAGFQAGEQLLTVNGQRIVTVVDWLAQRMNFALRQSFFWPTN
jgi:hypothetical protein